MSNKDKVNWPDVFQAFMDEIIVQAKITEYTGKGFKALIDEGKPLTEILKMLDNAAKKNGKSLSDMIMDC